MTQNREGKIEQDWEMLGIKNLQIPASQKNCLKIMIYEREELCRKHPICSLQSVM